MFCTHGGVQLGCSWGPGWASTDTISLVLLPWGHTQPTRVYVKPLACSVQKGQEAGSLSLRKQISFSNLLKFKMRLQQKCEGRPEKNPATVHVTRTVPGLDTFGTALTFVMKTESQSNP